MHKHFDVEQKVLHQRKNDKRELLNGGNVFVTIVCYFGQFQHH